MVFQFNDNCEFHVLESPTPFAVDLVNPQFPDGLDFNLSNRPAEIPLWNKYDKNWMVATMSLCKSILSDDGVLIVFYAIDMQTKKVLNSTLHNGNMKVLRTFICLNLFVHGVQGSGVSNLYRKYNTSQLFLFNYFGVICIVYSFNTIYIFL